MTNELEPTWRELWSMFRLFVALKVVRCLQFDRKRAHGRRSVIRFIAGKNYKSTIAMVKECQGRSQP